MELNTGYSFLTLQHDALKKLESLLKLLIYLRFYYE